MSFIFMKRRKSEASIISRLTRTSLPFAYVSWTKKEKKVMPGERIICESVFAGRDGWDMSGLTGGPSTCEQDLCHTIQEEKTKATGNKPSSLMD